jgi:hypothetical protein
LRCRPEQLASHLPCQFDLDLELPTEGDPPAGLGRRRFLHPEAPRLVVGVRSSHPHMLDRLTEALAGSSGAVFGDTSLEDELQTIDLNVRTRCTSQRVCSTAWVA